jgi:cyclophilin family peptidyl-prolyl cis-trans isomerase
MLLVILIIILCIVFYNYKNKRTSQPLIKKNEKKQKAHKPQINREKVNIDQIISKLEIEKPKDQIYMIISVNDKPIGKIVFKLFEDIVPITCRNFKILSMNTNNLSYKGSPFHRIIKDFMIQGGDFTNEDGTGGISIYGENFADENFILKHNKPYLLSMANAGPNTNGSQFFITTSKTPHLDGKHVVFGEVIEGFEIVDYLNNIRTGENDKPLDNIRIMNCGG